MNFEYLKNLKKKYSRTCIFNGKDIKSISNYKREMKV